MWKCCSQYISKFGKLSHGHRTRKAQFSFQSQRRTMPNNVQTIAQFPSFHMLARWCSKSFRLSKLQQYVNRELPDVQADLEKAEEPESKLPIFIWSQKKQGNSRGKKKKIYFCFIDYTKALDCVDHNPVYVKLLNRLEYQITLSVSWETCIQVKKQQNQT